MELSMDKKAYNAAVKKIDKAAGHATKNCKNFKLSFGSCTGATVESYQAAIDSLKAQLESYSTSITNDINKLENIRKNYEEMEKKSTVK